MSSNISDPLPKKKDNSSEKVRKTSGYLDNIEMVLVNINDRDIKEGNTDMVDKTMKTKPNVVKEAITTPISIYIKN